MPAEAPPQTRRGKQRKRRIGAFNRQCHKNERKNTVNNPKTLSLVIPCYNEERTLANCVKRVLAIATADLRLELIIVDDSSTDKSLMVVA